MRKDKPTEKITLLLTTEDFETIEDMRYEIRKATGWRVGATSILRPWCELLLERFREGDMPHGMALENESELKTMMMAFEIMGRQQTPGDSNAKP